MATEHQKNSAHLIIHSCAATSAAAAAAWSTIPIIGSFSIIVGADSPVLASITAGMVVSLGKLFGHSYEKGAAMAVVSQLIGFVFGVNIARGLASLIPGFGSFTNAATAAGMQEAIGWAFFYIFDEGKDPTKMTTEEIFKYIKK